MTSRLQDSVYVGCIQNELVRNLSASPTVFFFIAFISLIQEAKLESVYKDDAIISWLF